MPVPHRRISAPGRAPARRMLRRALTPAGSPSAHRGLERALPDGLSAPHAVEIAGLLHELSARLLAAESLTQALDGLAAFAAEVVPGTVRCSVALIGEGGPATIVGHGPAGRQVDEVQYATGAGPGLDAARTRALVTAQRLVADARWPGLAEAARDSGVASVVAVPIDVQRASVGALSLYAAAPDGVGADMLVTAMAVANQAEVLLGELRRREARMAGAVVDRAAGVIIAQRNCGVQEAYAFLQDTAQRLGLDRRTVAERLIAAVARG